MLKIIDLVPAASEVILRPPEAVLFETEVLLHNMDIQLCCFLAGIYSGLPNQIFKSCHFSSHFLT